jgi:uncharacterized protein (TIRG00374 family)
MREGAGKAFKVLAGLAISACFIWLTLRNKDLSQIAHALRTANYWYLVPYAAITVAIHFLRVIRWGILLEPVGKPSFKKLNSAGGIGFMALVIVPFRLGELARPLLIAEGGKLRRSAAMASVVVERVVDGLAMAVVLMVALLFSQPASTNANTLYWARMSGVGVFAFFTAILVFLVFAYLKRELAVRLTNRIVRPISQGLAKKLAGMIDAFIGGLKVVPDRRKVLLFFLLTATYWGINGIGMAILARGFGLPLGLVAAFAVLGVLVAGVMIPAGPGMIGPFHAAVQIGMELFFPASTAQGSVVAYAWVLWAAQFSQQVLFGIYFLSKGHIALGSLWQSSSTEEEAREVGEQRTKSALEP